MTWDKCAKVHNVHAYQGEGSNATARFCFDHFCATGVYLGNNAFLYLDCLFTFDKVLLELFLQKSRVQLMRIIFILFLNDLDRMRLSIAETSFHLEGDVVIYGGIRALVSSFIRPFTVTVSLTLECITFFYYYLPFFVAGIRQKFWSCYYYNNEQYSTFCYQSL